jgi:hypothetical protein
MQKIGLAAFCVTTCVLVPAALHTLTASSKQVAKLAAPDAQALILDGVRIDAAVDKAIVDPGDKVHVTLKATGGKTQKVTVDVMVLEATGTGGGRVESPPNKVALEQVSLIPNGPSRELAFPLRGYRGAEMDGQSPFGRYTILVMRPREAKKLDRLRRTGGSDEMGYNEPFFSMYETVGDTIKTDPPTQDQDGTEAEEDLGTPGTSARLDVITRPKGSPVAIKAPETARVGEPFTVTVRVTNRSQKPIEKMRIELSKPEMLYGLHYNGLEDDKVQMSESVEMAFKGRETKDIKFTVTATEAGIVGLYAHTWNDDNYLANDVALDAVEVLPKDGARPVVGSR